MTHQLFTREPPSLPEAPSAQSLAKAEENLRLVMKENPKVIIVCDDYGNAIYSKDNDAVSSAKNDVEKLQIKVSRELDKIDFDTAQDFLLEHAKNVFVMIDECVPKSLERNFGPQSNGSCEETK
jgi:hypothetical protein